MLHRHDLHSILNRDSYSSNAVANVSSVASKWFDTEEIKEPEPITIVQQVPQEEGLPEFYLPPNLFLDEKEEDKPDDSVENLYEEKEAPEGEEEEEVHELYVDANTGKFLTKDVNGKLVFAAGGFQKVSKTTVKVKMTCDNQGHVYHKTTSATFAHVPKGFHASDIDWPVENWVINPATRHLVTNQKTAPPAAAHSADASATSVAS